MARPKKDNAEYFPHEAGMRNDDRVKALRKKYKLQGYAIWNMLIEYLAGKDNFRFEYNDFTLEIIAGDFDAEVPDIQNVISYCLTLGLLQNEDGFIMCKRLEKGLHPLLSKRKRDRDRVNVSENPQSIVEYSKVKESKGEKSKVDDACVEEVVDEKVLENVPREATELIENILRYFGASTDVMGAVFARVTAFVEKFHYTGQIEKIKTILEKYQEYKARSQERIHGIDKWIGTPVNHYQDGVWAMNNWEQKLINLPGGSAGKATKEEVDAWQQE